MYAFEYTAGWGAVLTVVVAIVGVAGSVGGVILTQRSNRKTEMERATAAAQERAADRAHERELREVELRAEVRARLYADRRSSYQELRRRYLDYQRAEAESTNAFQRLNTRIRELFELEEVLPEERQEQEELRKQFETHAQRAAQCRNEFEASLADIEVVASRAVYEAAVEVGRRTRETSVAQRRLDESNPANPDDWVEAYGRVTDALLAVIKAEKALREAIRVELELDH